MKLTSRRFLATGLCVCSIGLINLEGQQTRQIDLVSRRSNELKLLRSNNGVAQVNLNLISQQVNSNELLFERLDSPVIKMTPELSRVNRDLNIPGIALPFQFHGIQANGNNLDLLTVIDIVPKSGLRYSPATSIFEGTLFIGIYNSQHPGDRYSLPRPIEFLITADVDHNPSLIRLDHVNFPFASVALSAEAPQEPVRVSIRPSFSSEPQIIELGVIRPTLSLDVSPRSIWGFGLAEADITIQIKDLASIRARDIPVALTTTKGSLSQLNVRTNEAGIAASKIRSIGIGSATIKADSSRFQSAESNLTFAFPWTFLLAAIVGGLVGTAARKKFKFTLKNITKGTSLGLLGGAGYAIGVNLTGFMPQASAGEALTLFVAGIVSYMAQITLQKSK